MNDGIKVEDFVTPDLWTAWVDTAILALLVCWWLMDRTNTYFRKDD